MSMETCTELCQHGVLLPVQEYTLYGDAIRVSSCPLILLVMWATIFTLPPYLVTQYVLKRREGVQLDAQILVENLEAKEHELDGIQSGNATAGIGSFFRSVVV